MTALIDKLHQGHHEIESLTRAVARSIRADERGAMHDGFATLERKLLDHMSWEEMYILPTFTEDFPASAAKIRADHTEFRARLGEIGLAIDLHAVRADHFDDLAARLRAHAEREEIMYSTISDVLPAETAEAIDSRYDRFLAVLRHVPRLGG